MAAIKNSSFFEKEKRCLRAAMAATSPPEGGGGKSGPGDPVLRREGGRDPREGGRPQAAASDGITWTKKKRCRGSLAGAAIGKW